LESNTNSQDKRIFRVLFLPCKEETMERTNDITTTKALTAACLALVTSAGWANDTHDTVRFVAALQTTSWIVERSPEGRCATPKVPLLEAVGAGEANLVGVVFEKQSHCIGEGGSFERGKFTLTNRYGKTVEGRYFGTLVPTLNSKFRPRPSGNWLIDGRVCIVSIGGRAVSDCRYPPRNYDPARGIADLNPANGAPAALFIDQVVRFR
jgi:hypothetical protein